MTSVLTKKCFQLRCNSCGQALSLPLVKRSEVQTGMVNSNDNPDGIEADGYAVKDNSYFVHLDSNSRFFKFDITKNQSCCCGFPPSETLNLLCGNCGVSVAREVSECCFFNYIRVPLEKAILAPLTEHNKV